MTDQHRRRKCQPRQRSLSLVLLGLIALLLSACGAGRSSSSPRTSLPVSKAAPTQPPAPTQAPTATPTLSLEEAARAEGGKMMLYTSMNPDEMKAILGAFKQRYPFVTPEFVESSGDELIQKVIDERKQGQPAADVVETTNFEVYRLFQQGMLERFAAPESEAYPLSAREASGYWTVSRINTVVLAYNSKLVTPEQAPKSWEDLLDPRWQGKIGIESSDVELLASMAEAWGQQRAFQLWEGLAAQTPVVMEGHTEIAELIASGEILVSPTVYGHRIEKLKAKGEPVEWVRTEPVFVFTNLAALTRDAPHPATARLFINWLLSEEGQNAIRDQGRIPARPGIKVEPASLTEGIKLYYTNPELAEDYIIYATKWTGLFLQKP